MPKVEDIVTISLDDNKTYAVADLPEEIQNLVEMYNEWRRKEAEIATDLTIHRAALETLTRQIMAAVKEFDEQKEKEASDTQADDTQEA